MLTARWLPKAAGARDQEPGGWQAREVTLQFWRPNVQNQAIGRAMFLLQGLGDVLPACHSGWKPQAPLGSWLRRSGLGLCLHVTIFFVSLFQSSSAFFFS